MTTYAQGKLFGSGKQRNTLPAPSEEGEQMTLIAWRRVVEDAA